MTGIALRLSSDMIGADKNNFVHNFLLTNTGRAPVFVRLFPIVVHQRIKIINDPKWYSQVDSLVDSLEN